jgi:hypothetical protein
MLADDYWYTPGTSGLRLALVGGAFTSAQYPGRWSTAWLPATVKGAARCGFAVP